MRLRLFFVMAVSLAATTVLAAGDPVTDLVLGGVERKADDLLNRFQDAGVNIGREVAKEAKGVIEAWRKANSSLLGEGFDRLKQADQDLFNNMNRTLGRLEAGETLAMVDVQRVTAQWAGVLKDLPTVNHDPEVWTYFPRVVLPSGQGLIPLHVIGPKLAGPKLTLALGAAAVALHQTTDQELIAELDRGWIDFDPDKARIVNYRFEFQKSASVWWNPISWGRTEPVVRDLSVLSLPKIMATLTLESKVDSVVMETGTFESRPGGTGKDATYHFQVVVPPDLLEKGWVIDKGRLLTAPFDDNNGDGDGGSSCTGPDRNTFRADGFTFNIQHGSKGRSDAHQNCHMAVPIMKSTPTVVPGPTIERTLNWTDDSLVPLPPKTASYLIRLRMFDGRSYIVTPNSLEPYGVVEISREKDSLLFRPNPPKDF